MTVTSTVLHVSDCRILNMGKGGENCAYLMCCFPLISLIKGTIALPVVMVWYFVFCFGVSLVLLPFTIASVYWSLTVTPNMKVNLGPTQPLH